MHGSAHCREQHKVTPVATLVARQEDLLDISEREDAGFTALDVANHSNPVPDVRIHSLMYHVEAVFPSVSGLAICAAL